MPSTTEKLRDGLRDVACPLLFAAAGAEVIAQVAGVRPLDRDIGALVETMTEHMAEVHRQARLAAEVVRIEVGLATAAVALVRPDERDRALRELRPLVRDIGPPDWVGSQAHVLERAGLELLARRPWSARRCASVLLQRDEPALARWVRIAASQVERGCPVIELEQGMELGARERALLTPAARVTLRLLVQAFGEEGEVLGSPVQLAAV